MKPLLDFLPLLVFFIFYKIFDIYTASAALIVATALALFVSWLLYRKVEKVALVTFVLVAIFGTLTLVFHSDEFIKWKVTAIYTIFGVFLLFSQFFMERPMIQSILGKEITLPLVIWQKVNMAWALFFFGCGILNLYVAFRLPQSTWVNFKVFGLTGLTLFFALCSGAYLYWMVQKNPEQDAGVQGKKEE